MNDQTGLAHDDGLADQLHLALALAYIRMTGAS